MKLMRPVHLRAASCPVGTGQCPNTHMRIIEIGCVPPPFGGVSVHLQRLLLHLKQRGIPHLLFDISGVSKSADNVICTRWRSAVVRLLREPRAIVHFHNFSPRNLILYSLLGLKHATILTLHNERFAEELNSLAAPVGKMTVKMLNRLDKIIVASEKCCQALSPLIKHPDKIIICPEFIAPTIPDNPVLPEEIVSLRRQHKYLISSNAFEIRFHQGKDLYGIDLLIELVANLAHEEGLDVALVFLLPSIGDRQYFEKLKARIDQLKIGASFLFVTKPVIDANDVWRVSDLVIRATNTDGSSLTVKEALWCGTPVIASDCAPRDPAAILFRTGDLNDLKAKAVTVLTQSETYRARLENLQFADNVETLIDIYNRFLSGR